VAIPSGWNRSTPSVAAVGNRESFLTGFRKPHPNTDCKVLIQRAT
jgi:hypothetical protein